MVRESEREKGIIVALDLFRFLNITFDPYFNQHLLMACSCSTGQDESIQLLRIEIWPLSPIFGEREVLRGPDQECDWSGCRMPNLCPMISDRFRLSVSLEWVTTWAGRYFSLTWGCWKHIGIPYLYTYMVYHIPYTAHMGRTAISYLVEIADICYNIRFVF